MGIGAAAAVGAVGSVAGGLISGSASSKAAKEQEQAQTNALNLEKATQGTISAAYQPYLAGGTNALNILNSLYGGGPNAATSVNAGTAGTNGGTLLNPTSLQTALAQTPGYQFALQQGLRSVQNSNAARGLGISGAAMKGAANYATGLANQNYTSNLLNPLEYLASLGSQNVSNYSNALMGVSGAQSSLMTGIGNSQAAGTTGAASALTNGINGVGSNLSNYALYQGLTGGGGNTSGNTANSSSGNFDPFAGNTLGG